MTISTVTFAQQEPVYESLQVQSVSFGNPYFAATFPLRPPVEFRGNIPIMKDNHDEQYTEPQYTDSGSKPVAFVSGSRVGISATFIADLNCFPSGTELYIKPSIASAPGGVLFPVRKCIVTQSGIVEYRESPLLIPGGSHSVLTPKVASSLLLTDRMVSASQLEAVWRYSLSPSVLNSTAGRSTNKFYTTYKTRDAESGVYSNSSPLHQSPLPHTVIAVGCEAANRISSENPILSAITAKFSGLSIQSADDGSPLTYYENWTTGCSNTEGLLTTSDGQCGSWSKFYLDVLYAQGIKSVATNSDGLDYNEVKVSFVGPQQGFFVNDWAIDHSSLYARHWITYVNDAGPYNNSNVAPFGILAIPVHSQQALDNILFNNNRDLFEQEFWLDNKYNFEDPPLYKMPISDVDGIPGQSTPNPLSNFGNHIFSATNQGNFDPSYGTEYANDPNNFAQYVTFLYDTGSIILDESLYDHDWNSDGMTSGEVRRITIILDPNVNNFNLDIIYMTYE